MNPLELATFALASLMAVAVGCRLLLVASRSRELPELAIGLAMLLEVVSAVSWAVAPHGPSGQLVSSLAASLSVLCMAVFVPYTFSPGRVWSRGAATLLVLGVAAGLVLATASGGWGAADFYVRFGWVFSAARALVFGWAAVAAARSRSALRRRARLGLSHPLTASRVGFWSLSAGVASVSYAVPLFVLVTGTAGAVGISPVSALLAVGASVFMWLAFYPPQAYVEWALRQAERA